MRVSTSTTGRIPDDDNDDKHTSFLLVSTHSGQGPDLSRAYETKSDSCLGRRLSTDAVEPKPSNTSKSNQYSIRPDTSSKSIRQTHHRTSRRPGRGFQLLCLLNDASCCGCHIVTEGGSACLHIHLGISTCRYGGAPDVPDTSENGDGTVNIICVTRHPPDVLRTAAAAAVDAAATGAATGAAA